MFFDAILQSAPGAYACLIIVGACFGIQIADATVPVERWAPKIASLCTLFVAFLYAHWIVQIAPLGIAVFIFAELIAQSLWTARLYGGISEYSDLRFGQRLHLVIWPSHPVGDFSKNAVPGSR
ncbi:hypothetical protein JD292_06935 [Leucobacter sp. CSA2]|uniref:Uncharacterized protein n=1 Tax=Leucobacter edaphi TaxID=2796472 RepID=A0A934UXA2_9MICO|nr:hypothetical protein [Leucobacter edaphi]MBK0421805.1 hypothetical protein [Leucobacter edaphi]